MLIFKDVFIINLAKKGKNPAQLSKRDNEIIMDIFIKLAVRIQTIIEYSNSEKDYIKNLVIDTNKNKQRVLHTFTTLMVLQENKNFYLPQQIKEKVIETFDSINKDPKSLNSYHITKILRELANDGILENIKTKKNIKERGLSKDFRKEKSDEGGYPSVYSISPNIKEYKKILGNPYAINEINQMLKKYGKLDQFYALIGEAVIKMMITVPEELKFLELFSKNISSSLDGTETVFSYWDTAVARAKELSENEIKELCTDFANSMANNPNSLEFICFIISL